MSSRYHEDGRAKPVIAIASMIDTTPFECPWSVSEELTSMISSQIAQSGEIYVNPREEFAFAENPFGQDLSWVKREFTNHEFVVFLELVEHENAPVSKDRKITQALPLQELSTNISMAVRIRVLDLRGATSKIVLQEMVRDSYYIPKTLLPTDYNQIAWGSEEYSSTPMGIAHAKLVQEIVSRLSDYILLAKSR
ncbi:MAG: hypothetical protein KGJ02_02905 [Verrucomicrobiota bacterium]|nr:hypothetical protein [Verrucomicrobiota bacterium]